MKNAGIADQAFDRSDIKWHRSRDIRPVTFNRPVQERIAIDYFQGTD